MTCTDRCPDLTGTRGRSHCGCCHHTFSGPSVFDDHRRAGSCVLPGRLVESGDGIWRFPASGTGSWRSTDALHQL